MSNVSPSTSLRTPASLLSSLYTIEENFNSKYHQQWSVNNRGLIIFASLIYLTFVFFGQKCMHNRQPFNLRLTLSIWSLLLAIFSLFSSIRVLPEFYNTLFNTGFFESICSNSFTHSSRYLFWIYLFVWSKIIEFGDTVFIVLRKQKLIHLHWIHHVLTSLYAFEIFIYLPGFTRWLLTMNAVIHTFMYSYYFLRASRLVQLPAFISVWITTAQILQMVFGFLACLLAFIYSLLDKENCQISVWMSINGTVLYLIFLLLFSNFYHKTYLPRGNDKQKNI